MFNVFPALLTYKLIGPFLLRLALGLFFLAFGWNKVTKDKEIWANEFEKRKLKPGHVFVWIFGVIEITVALFTIVGAFTQVAVLISALFLIALIVLKKRRATCVKHETDIYYLLLLIAISLLFSGAGFFSLDLPL